MIELTCPLSRSDQDIMRATGLFHFFPMDNLADLTLSVYFSQAYSEIDFITVNFGLHYLFQAYSSQVIEAEREKCLNSQPHVATISIPAFQICRYTCHPMLEALSLFYVV